MKLTVDDILNYVQRIDQQIISLLGKRNELMGIANKVTETSQEVNEILYGDIITKNINECSKQHNLCPHLVEEVYHSIIRQYIKQELDVVNK